MEPGSGPFPVFVAEQKRLHFRLRPYGGASKWPRVFPEPGERPEIEKGGTFGLRVKVDGEPASCGDLL